jgi:predicted DNA-binding antitoxin AbrB/MazE fold protein
MLNTVWAVVREGRIELLEPVDLAEGTKVLVTVLQDEEAEFWLHVSQVALGSVWDNDEDDIYAELLEE